MREQKQNFESKIYNYNNNNKDESIHSKQTLNTRTQKKNLYMKRKIKPKKKTLANL